LEVRDNAAELFVAACFAEAGWNVYFPHRDKGFDFIVSKDLGDGRQVLKPVQVKGKYPSESKTKKNVYGFVGRLSETHPDMVLAIPYYAASQPNHPKFVAYMPRCEVRDHSRGFRCQPASFRDSDPEMRPGFRGFFDSTGLELLEAEEWGVTPAEAYGWIGQAGEPNTA
jgi:hypothetical protein